MATYNAEKYLRESIQSVLSQTHEYFELIIVNDNSSDASYEIIRQFAKEDERIVHITNDRNLRQSDARNKAIKTSTLAASLSREAPYPALAWNNLLTTMACPCSSQTFITFTPRLRDPL